MKTMTLKIKKSHKKMKIIKKKFPNKINNKKMKNFKKNIKFLN